MRLPVRVLRIEAGKDKDDVGRGVGDDWLLASFGTDHDGAEYHLTTDSVHASELGDDEDLLPGRMAHLVADFLNGPDREAELEDRLRNWLERRRLLAPFTPDQAALVDDLRTEFFGE